MTDIVERLRELADGANAYTIGELWNGLDEAADEIDQLRARIAELENERLAVTRIINPDAIEQPAIGDLELWAERAMEESAGFSRMVWQQSKRIAELESEMEGEIEQSRDREIDYHQLRRERDDLTARVAELERRDLNHYTEQHHRDSAELRRLCAARDEQRKGRGDLVQALTELCDEIEKHSIHITELCDEIEKHSIHTLISATNITLFRRKAREALAAAQPAQGTDPTIATMVRDMNGEIEG